MCTEGFCRCRAVLHMYQQHGIDSFFGFWVVSSFESVLRNLVHYPREWHVLVGSWKSMQYWLAVKSTGRIVWCGGAIQSVFVACGVCCQMAWPGEGGWLLLLLLLSLLIIVHSKHADKNAAALYLSCIVGRFLCLRCVGCTPNTAGLCLATVAVQNPPWKCHL